MANILKTVGSFIQPPQNKSQRSQRSDFFQQNFPFSYILQNPPTSTSTSNSSQSLKQCSNDSNSSSIANSIAQKIIQYNQQTWHFGNIISNNSNKTQFIAVQPLMNSDTYNQFNQSKPQFTYQPTDYFHPHPNPFMQHQQQQFPNINQQKIPQMYNPSNPNYLQGQNTSPIQQQNYSDFFQSKMKITNDIKQLLQKSQSSPFCIVNTFINIKLNQLFPALPSNMGATNLKITLLGLAAIIGAEHLVILFLNNGAIPSLTNQNNKDSAYNMLHIQAGFQQLLRQQTLANQSIQKTSISTPNQFLSQHQQQSQQLQGTNLTQKQLNSIFPMFYFINDQRIEYILTLLGSVKGGIDLSNIVPTEVPVQILTIGQQSQSQPIYLRSNILCQLSKEDSLYNTNVVMGGQNNTIANSSYNILNFIFFFNGVIINGNQLKLFSDINAKTVPFSYTPLFYVLGNRTLTNFQQKLRLVSLMINQGANPTIMPNIAQNASKKNMPVFNTICELLHTYYQGPLYEQLNNVLLRNAKYKKTCQTYYNQQNLSNVNSQTLIQKLRQAQQKILLQSQLIAKLERQISQNKPTISSQFSSNTSQFSPFSPFHSDNQNYSQPPPMQNYSQQPPTQNYRQQPMAQSPYNNSNSGYESKLFNNQNYSQQLQPMPHNQSQPPMPNRQQYVPPPPLSGGKEIKLRTFHFPKQKSYQERAFKATQPKIAAENAYDFLKTHYKLDGKQIVFTIEDRQKKRKYKYSAKTSKNGIDTLKSIN